MYGRIGDRPGGGVRLLGRRIVVAAPGRRACGFLVGGAEEQIVDRVVPMREIDEAHRAMQANETFGKIVLNW